MCFVLFQDGIWILLSWTYISMIPYYTCQNSCSWFLSGPCKISSAFQHLLLLPKYNLTLENIRFHKQVLSNDMWFFFFFVLRRHMNITKLNLLYISMIPFYTCQNVLFMIYLRYMLLYFCFSSLSIIVYSHNKIDVFERYDIYIVVRAW